VSMRVLKLEELADLQVWRALQARIAEVTALRLGLWDEDAQRVLPPPMPPPACQYVLSEPDRRERCEQFHGSIRAEVRRRQRVTCKTCPFGVQYMALPIVGEGLLAGHWEGGYVVAPGPPHRPDASLDEQTWFSALAVTPHRTRKEVEAALALLELLHRPLMQAVALRERRRDQVAQLVGYELGRTLDATRSPADALKRCMHLASQVMAVAILYLRDPAKGEFFPAAWEIPEHAAPLTRIAPGLGIVGGVYATGKSVLVADLRERPELEGAHGPFEKARAIVAVPVRAEGAITGVFALASYAPNAFDSDDVGLVGRLAELVEGLLQRDLLAELAGPDATGDDVRALIDTLGRAPTFEPPGL
jgi:ligand-binding sensor protein